MLRYSSVKILFIHSQGKGWFRCSVYWIKLMFVSCRHMVRTCSFVFWYIINMNTRIKVALNLWPSWQNAQCVRMWSTDVVLVHFWKPWKMQNAHNVHIFLPWLHLQSVKIRRWNIRCIHCPLKVTSEGVCGFSHTNNQFSNFPTPTRYPTIQWIQFWHYLESSQTSQIKGLVPQDSPYLRHELLSPRAHPYFSNTNQL